MSEQRIIELETKISHQELALDSLQRSYYEQQKSLEKLALALQRLVAQIEGAAASFEGPPGDEKPPHY